jgi:hypothetical protein
MGTALAPPRPARESVRRHPGAAPADSAAQPQATAAPPAAPAGVPRYLAAFAQPAFARPAPAPAARGTEQSETGALPVTSGDPPRTAPQDAAATARTGADLAEDGLEPAEAAPDAQAPSAAQSVPATVIGPSAAASASEDVDDRVMRGELAEVLAMGGIQAERSAGQPTVLAPSGPMPEEQPAPAAALEPPRAQPAPAAAAAGPAPAAEPPAGERTIVEELAAGTQVLEQAQQAAMPGEEGPSPHADDAPSAAGPGEGAADAAPLPTDVPPPDPSALQAAIPEREPTQQEFLELFESGTSPEQDRAQVAALLATLRAEAETHKAAIATEAETQKALLLAGVQEQAAAVQRDAAALRARIGAHCAGARTARVAATAQSRAQLSTQIAGQVAALEAGSALRTADAEGQLTQRTLQMNEAAAARSREPGSIAEQEVARSDRELEAAAGQCEQAGRAEAARHPGSEEPNPDKRAAALEVATESAADIRDKKPSLAADVRERAAEFSGGYFAYADSVNAQIAQARADLIPLLAEAAAAAIAELQASEAGAAAGLDERLATDLAALDAAEAGALAQVDAASARTLASIRQAAQAAAARLDGDAATLQAGIHASLQETEAVASGAAEPLPGGMRDVIEATRAAIAASAADGCAGLAQSATATLGQLAEAAAGFATQAGALESAAARASAAVVQSGSAAAAAVLAGQASQGESAIAALASRQEQLSAGVMTEIDTAIAQATAELDAINTRFAGDLRSAVDEGIAQAILPRTDQVEDRAQEAAAQVDDGWFSGLVRAIGQIVVGLLIMVAVALVVAAIAAAFGVILTAWTAVMIAGAILLVVGFVLAVAARSGQAELSDSPWYAIAGYALADTVGITGIAEGITGHDFVTGRALTQGEQTERGVMGAFTLVSLVLGARAAIKGPPGGAFFRPNLVPRGWVGWRAALPQAWRGMRVTGIEMYTGLRLGARNLNEWVRTRVLGAEPTRAPPELLDAVGEPSTAETLREAEMPYRNPPEMMTARRGQPIDVSQLDPARRYLWVVDAEGNFIIAPENQPGFKSRVVHGDLTPGAGGEFRGTARAAGELNARVGPNGEVTWVMDSDSSYSFNRSDGAVLGEPSRTAAHDVLTDTGTNTESIDVQAGDGWPLTEPRPPRSGAAPVVPPLRLPEESDATAP